MKDLDMFVIEETKDEPPKPGGNYKWVGLLIVLYIIGCIIMMVE